METEQGTDFISSLPPDVLIFIASKIPLKDAIRTAVLSTAWRTLWRGAMLKLEVGSTQTAHLEAREKIKQIIGTFSMYFDYPDRLKLCINSVPDNSNISTNDCPRIVDESFAVVTKGTQGELHIDFSAGRDESKASRITKFNLILETGTSTTTLNCPGFSSLRSLHLRSVTHVAQNLVTDLFSSSLPLESLTLEKCSGLLNIDIRANNGLRNLRIADCFDINSIQVFAPCLEAFSYRGILSTVQLDTPQLVDAILNFRHGLGHNNFDCEDVLCLLLSLKDVETLTISGWLLDCLCMAGVIFGRLSFKFNKLKELVWIDSAMDARKRDSLACFLNNTPILERLFLKVDRKLNPIPSPILHEFWHEPHLWMDYAEVKCNASPLMYLKTIQLVGFAGGEEDEVLLMDLLLHMAVNLKDMIMISPEKDIWRVTVTPRSQLQYVVRRSQKHKLIPSPNGYSLYVLTQPHRSGLPAHPSHHDTSAI